MIDFSSALYLGFRHPLNSLKKWNSLTSGRPASFGEPREARYIAKLLAELIGCEDGILFPSTLHAFFDLFWILADRGHNVLVDSGIYPIAWWGIQRAKLKGLQIRIFKHHDPLSLKIIISRAKRYKRPLIVTNGFCPCCGQPAPLRFYHEIANLYDGYLIIDDTQAFGILGEKQNSSCPYGNGGGGILKWMDLKEKNIIVINSLAKGFGVPLTILASSEEIIKKVRMKGQTLVHCSPPSIASISAAENALRINEKCGDYLRIYLAKLVIHFKNRLREIEVKTTNGFFPVQTLLLSEKVNIFHLHNFLIANGIRPLMHGIKENGIPKITFLIRTEHDFFDLEKVILLLYQALYLNRYKQSRFL